MLTIAPATHDDLPAMCELLALLFAQEADLSPDAQRQAAGLRLILDRPEVGQLFVARDEGQVVGMVSLLRTVSTAQGSWVCWLEDFVVRPEWRGRGVGTRLMERALEHARAEGFSRINLHTDRTNVAAQRFYRRAGFAESEMILLRRYVDLSDSGARPGTGEAGGTDGQ